MRDINGDISEIFLNIASKTNKGKNERTEIKEVDGWVKVLLPPSVFRMLTSLGIGKNIYDILSRSGNESEFKNIPLNENINESSQSDIKKAIESGEKIDMPFLEYNENGKLLDHDGRNRSFYVEQNGNNIIPVLVKGITAEKLFNQVSEAYHKAKANGSNPELVNEVEKLLTTKQDSTESKVQFQENRQPLGAAETLENGRMVLHFFENANLSTVIHEGLGHVMERELTPEQMIVIQEWSGTEGWTNETSEAFARGVERYFFDGVAPTNKLKDIFDGIKKYMKDIYVSIKGTELEADINPEAKAVLDKLFTAEEPVKTEAGKELSLQEKAKNINQKVLESRSYDIIAGLIRDGIIKQKPC